KIFQMPAVAQQTGSVDTGQTANPAPAANNSNIQPANVQRDRMTDGEKIKLGLRKAYFSAETYAFPVFNAFTQVRKDDEPHKDAGDLVADGLTRYAINFTTSSTRQLLSVGVYPIIFKQDPRYYPS